MMKKFVAFVFLAAVVLVGSWVVTAASRQEVLPLGSAAPSFAFATARGQATFHHSPRGRTLLILFHSQCTHCTYEFDTLDPQLDRLSGTELLLLTTEDSLNMAAIESRWPRLARSEQVTWGTVDRDVFAHHFGAVMTPALFLFDATGKLAGKWLGETKLELLLEPGHMGDGTGCATPQAATCGAEQPVLPTRRTITQHQ
ncbi:MAG: hypothetical protein IIA27_03055 [Gemmatimonadetes bacterium]|nr:hypothetical protein [Gemmatimonadota bacterium]